MRSSFDRYRTRGKRGGRNCLGQSITEYGAAIAFVAILAGLMFVSGMSTLKPAVNAGFASAANALGGPSEGGRPDPGSSNPSGGGNNHRN